MPLERSVSHLLRRASQAAEALFAGRDAITPRQIVLLGCVAENEGLSQAQIVLRTGIDRSTAAEMVRRLSKQGYLRQEQNKPTAAPKALR